MAASLERPYWPLGPVSRLSSSREANLVSDGVDWWALEAMLQMRTVLLFEAVFLRMGRRWEVRMTWAMWFIAI